MSVITRVAGADFSAVPGAIPIAPFPATADAAGLWDFRTGGRASRLADLSTAGATLSPLAVTPGSSSRPADPSIIGDIGTGLTLTQGCLNSDIDAGTALAVDGSKQHTWIVAGGWSGVAYTGPTSGTPVMAVLMDRGCFGSPSHGMAIEYRTDTGRIGVRIKSVNPVIWDYAAPGAPHFVALTYDGAKWTWYNKTRGRFASITNSEMGISSAIPAYSPTLKLYAGPYDTGNTSRWLIPALYRWGQYNRVLTEAEIHDIYLRTRASHPAAGL